MPPRLTANTALDALSHCIEGYLSPAFHPLADAMALAAITQLMKHIERAVSDGDDEGSRLAIMMGALAGGMAISKGLGPAHAIATALSHLPVPHGVLVLVSLPQALDLIQEHAAEKLKVLADAMGLPGGISAGQGLRHLLDRLRSFVPVNLRELGCRIADRNELRRLAETCASSPLQQSSAYAPTAAEYESLIEMAMGC
jgi:alcohol dehydrogenase class IV